MVDIDPKDRPTAEQIKSDPWFEGIDWDDVIHGPTAPRKYIHGHLQPYRVLIAVLVYRQLPTAPRSSGYKLLPAALHLRQAQHAEPGVHAQHGRRCTEGRGDPGGSTGDVRRRAARLRIPAARSPRWRRLSLRRAGTKIWTTNRRPGRPLKNGRDTTNDNCNINVFYHFHSDPLVSLDVIFV